MKRGFKLVIFWGLLMLFACNPKLEVNTPEVIEQKSYTKIDQFEKLFELNRLFENDPLLASLNQLASYYDAEVTTNELPSIAIRYLDGDYATDVLEKIQANGLTIFPILATYEEIESAVLERKPVYAQFNLIGSTILDVIFFGYSEDEFVMMDLNTGEERIIDRKRLAGVNEFKAFIPLENDDKLDEKLDESVLFIDLAISDAYYGNDGDHLLHYLKLIEKKKLENEVNAFRYLKSYYYTFFDRQLDIAEPLLQEDMQLSITPPHFELAFIIANEKQDEAKIKSILSQWQILPFYQDETLELIIEKGEQFGYMDKTKQAVDILNQRLERQR